MYFGIRYHLIKKAKYTPIRKKLLLIMLICYFITEVGRSFYRPYIYSNHIFDFYIADTLGSSFGTLTAMFMVILLVGKSDLKDMYLMVVIILGLMLYEVSDIGKASYDPHDMLAIIIFGIIGLIIYYTLLKLTTTQDPNSNPIKQNTTQKA